MQHARAYIRVTVVVFGLLLLTRIPALIVGPVADVDRMTLVSAIVELVLLVWGLTVLSRDAGPGTRDRESSAGHDVVDAAEADALVD